MGDKISFKIIVESCRDRFRLCLLFELCREFNKKGERCEIDNLKGISIIFFFYSSLSIYIYFLHLTSAMNF